jgi:hypothetical protein
VAERTFANDTGGHDLLREWLMVLPGPRRVGLEGAANFGAALAPRETTTILFPRQGRRSSCTEIVRILGSQILLRETAYPNRRDLSRPCQSRQSTGTRVRLAKQGQRPWSC